MIDPDTFHDLQEEVIYWAKEYMNENPLILSKLNYIDEITSAIYQVVYYHWEDYGIFNSWSEEDTISFIKYQVKQNVPKRYYTTSFPYSNATSLVSSTNTSSSPVRPIETPETIENTEIETTKKIEKIIKRVKELQEIDKQNPKQGTKEWLNQRHNMVTASSISKLFNSQAQYQSIIKEKSTPNLKQEYEQDKTRGPAPLVWGHKYEPITIEIYEHLTDEKVLSLGCIPHTQYPFLGASPDGIVSPFEEDNTSRKRAGRLLEIKNPISRVIDGIPSESYWIQQQIQMEVCDMDGCDFLETQFKEMDENDFYSSFYKHEDSPTQNPTTTSEISQNIIQNETEEIETKEDLCYTGVILYYQSYQWGDKYPKLKYLYLPPFTYFDSISDYSHNQYSSSDEEEEPLMEDSSDVSDVEQTEKQTEKPKEIKTRTWMNIKTKEMFTSLESFQQHIQSQTPQTHPDFPEYTILKKEFWKLKTLSLVYVPRNKEWFQSAQPVIEKAWETILQNRNSQTQNSTQNSILNFIDIIKQDE